MLLRTRENARRAVQLTGVLWYSVVFCVVSVNEYGTVPFSFMSGRKAVDGPGRIYLEYLFPSF